MEARSRPSAPTTFVEHVEQRGVSALDSTTLRDELRTAANNFRDTELPGRFNFLSRERVLANTSAMLTRLQEMRRDMSEEEQEAMRPVQTALNTLKTRIESSRTPVVDAPAETVARGLSELSQLARRHPTTAAILAAVGVVGLVSWILANKGKGVLGTILRWTGLVAAATFLASIGVGIANKGRPDSDETELNVQRTLYERAGSSPEFASLPDGIDLANPPRGAPSPTITMPPGIRSFSIAREQGKVAIRTGNQSYHFTVEYNGQPYILDGRVIRSAGGGLTITGRLPDVGVVEFAVSGDSLGGALNTAANPTIPGALAGTFRLPVARLGATSQARLLAAQRLGLPPPATGDSEVRGERAITLRPVGQPIARPVR